jgi:Leucine-rich repeat (LRR) protein
MDSKASELVYIVSYYSQEIKLAETIIFPREFNGSRIASVPEGVKHIELRKVRYNQELICLPESLKTLYLDCNFKEIKLPDALEYLELGPNSKGEIKQWPKSLKKLLICNSDINYLPPLPESLEYLSLVVYKYKFETYQWSGLPKSLKTLIVPSSFMETTERSLWLKDLSNLECLEFEGDFSSVSAVNAIIRNLPSGLKILRGLNILVSQKDIQGQFPDSLEYLFGDFNYKGILPKNLKVLYCPSCEISSSLPESLRYLYVDLVKGDGLKAISQLSKLETLICNRYNPGYEKDVSFPSSLQYLEIRSSAYNITEFPKSLKTLIIPRSVLSGSIRLPEKLETLRLTGCEFILDLYVPSGLKITFQYS